jgi:hypothetical protein
LSENPFHFRAAGQLRATVVTLQSIKPEWRRAVVRLIIAVVVGAAIALGGTALVTNVLSSQANGVPVPGSSSLYNYRTR